jgi:hypothetical protein
MRLSEIKGERVFDVIAAIIEPCCNIAQDESVADLFDRSRRRPEDMSAKDFALERVKASVPGLMRSHKGDLVAILAAIEGTDPDEYMRQVTVPSIVKAVYEILTDEDLLAFLS